MKKPSASHLADVTVVETPLGSWHGFTFPSNHVAGSAAQFNSGVSIAPPPHTCREINVSLRRHDGYTTQG
jgi:hypothetical protein